MAAYALVAAAFVSACSSASSALSVFAAGRNDGSSTAAAPTNAPPPPASAGTTRPDKKLMVQSKAGGGDLAGKTPTPFSKGDGGASAPKGDGGGAKGDGGGGTAAPSGGGASSSGGGGIVFSVPKALALLNQRRAKEGLPPFAIDTALMNGAQRRANAGEFPHTLDWYLAASACENLSVECKGSGDQAVEWAIYKLYDFERDNKTNATAPGSPCFAVIPTDQGHYRNFTNKVAACSSNKLGIGVAPLKKFNGGAPPPYMTTLVVFWIK